MSRVLSLTLVLACASTVLVVAKDKDVSAPTSTTCHCTDTTQADGTSVGTAATGPACTEDGNNCATCNTGYWLNGTQCVPKTPCNNATHCAGVATSMNAYLEDSGSCCLGCQAGSDRFLSNGQCKQCSNAVCAKTAEHSSSGTSHQWADFLTGVRLGQCSDADGDAYHCEQKDVGNGGTGVSGARTGAAADQHNAQCYRNHAWGSGEANPHQRSNVAACKIICDATKEAEACAVVQMDARICPEGYARKGGAGSICEACTSDADFLKYNGCGVECSHITCENKEHTCEGQSLYADGNDENTLTSDIDHNARNFFRAKYATFTNANAGGGATPPSTSESNCVATTSIVTAHPKNHAANYGGDQWENYVGDTTNPGPDGEFIGNTVVTDKSSKRYGLYEIHCTRGHQCRNEPGVGCKCRPTHKPTNYQPPQLSPASWGPKIYGICGTGDNAGKRQYTQLCENAVEGATCLNDDGNDSLEQTGYDDDAGC